MIDHIHWVSTEAARFHQLVTGEAGGSAGSVSRWGELKSMPVPTCPGWTVADLTWHLAEVHYFWSAIVEGNLANPAAAELPERRADEALPDMLAEQSARLVSALTARNPGEPCWSWHPDGGRVGWVRRFQAHEALMHRIDAELAVGTAQSEFAPIDEDLAADGIDVLLNVLLRGQDPAKQTDFRPDGAAVSIEVPGRTWLVELGQMPGDSPADDALPAVRVVDGVDGQPPAATVNGAASVVDRWLWRRGTLPDETVSGDRSVVDRFHALAHIE
jgi:uncharacterized protein (TIGR03083 family)